MMRGTFFIVESDAPYGPGSPDYEYDKWRQEQVDDEVEAARLANLKGELLWPDSEKRKQNKQH